METSAGRGRAVGVDGHDGVGVGVLPGATTFVDAGAHPIVVGAREHDPHAAVGQPPRHALRDVEGEGVLGVACVGGGPGGVAGLRAAPAVGDRPVDRRGRDGVAPVVAGIEDDDARTRGDRGAGDGRGEGRRGSRSRSRRRGRDGARRRSGRREWTRRGIRRGGRTGRQGEHGDDRAAPQHGTDSDGTGPELTARQGGHAAKPATTTLTGSRPARMRVTMRGDRECNRVSPICR